MVAVMFIHYLKSYAYAPPEECLPNSLVFFPSAHYTFPSSSPPFLSHLLLSATYSVINPSYLLYYLLGQELSIKVNFFSTALSLKYAIYHRCPILDTLAIT